MLKTQFTLRRFAAVGMILFMLATLNQTPAATTGNFVTDITFDRPTPNILLYGDKVTVSFKYTTNFPKGVVIYADAFSGTVLAENGNPVLHSPTGSGTASATFSVSSHRLASSGAWVSRGPRVTVTKIRIQMRTSDNKVLFQGFVPVHYEFCAGSRDTPVAMAKVSTGDRS